MYYTKHNKEMNLDGLILEMGIKIYVRRVAKKPFGNVSKPCVVGAEIS